MSFFATIANFLSVFQAYSGAAGAGTVTPCADIRAYADTFLGNCAVVTQCIDLLTSVLTANAGFANGGAFKEASFTTGISAFPGAENDGFVANNGGFGNGNSGFGNDGFFGNTGFGNGGFVGNTGFGNGGFVGNTGFGNDGFEGFPGFWNDGFWANNGGFGNGNSGFGNDGFLGNAGSDNTGFWGNGGFANNGFFGNTGIQTAPALDPGMMVDGVQITLDLCVGLVQCGELGPDGSFNTCTLSTDQGCKPLWVGDGICDEICNTAEFNNDGGDCASE